MKKPMKMQMDKCPRLSYLKNRISITQKEIEELNNLVRLSTEELSKDKSDFEKCEIRIKVLRANKNLPTLYVDLERTEADFKKWKTHIQKFMDEANVDYDQIVKGIVKGDIVKMTIITPRVMYHLLSRKKFDKSLAILLASERKAPRTTAKTFNQQ